MVAISRRLPSILPALVLLACLAHLSFAITGNQIVIGATSSAVGPAGTPLTDALSHANGLRFMVQWVNNIYGGVVLNGTRYTLSLKLYDDAGNPTLAPIIYKYMLETDKVDFFFSPYARCVLLPFAPVLAHAFVRSAMVTSVASFLDGIGRPWMNIGGASVALFARNSSNMFAIIPPADTYLPPCLDAIRGFQPRSAVLYTQNSGFPLQLAGFARSALQSWGVTILANDTYDTNSTSASMRPNFERYQQMNPDLFVGGGYEVDGTLILNSIITNSVVQFRPRLMLLFIAASSPAFGRQSGWKAGYVASNAAWSPSFPYNDTLLGNATAISGPRFQELFTNFIGSEPGYQSAFAMAAGIALLRAMERSQSVDPDLVRAQLQQMDEPSLVGPLRWTRGGGGALATPPSACVQLQPDPSSNVRPATVTSASIGQTVQRVVAPPILVANNVSFIYGQTASPPDWLLDYSVVRTNSPAAIVFIVVSAIGIALVLVFLGLFIVYRDSPPVETSRWPYIGSHLVGLAFFFAAIIVLSLEPSDASCILTTVFSGLAVALVLGSPLAKLIRIFRLVSNSSMLVVPMPAWEFFAYLAPLILVQVIILAVWGGISPQSRVVLAATQEYSFVVKCVGSRDWIFLGIELGYFGVLLLAIVWMWASMRKLLPKLFWGEFLLLPLVLFGTAALAAGVIATRVLLADQPVEQLIGSAVCLLSGAFLHLFGLHGRKVHLLLFRQSLLSAPAESEFNTEFKPDDIGVVRQAD
jgi:ABC-type branched-subunit amino acid transport system substrate-binding protein